MAGLENVKFLIEEGLSKESRYSLAKIALSRQEVKTKKT
jgi:hypothetical protein